MKAEGPHAGMTPATMGVPASEAAAGLILVHGRGGSAEDILGLADFIGAEDLAVVAPRATNHTWYPQSFLAPVEANEPGRSSGLSVLDAVVENLAAEGIPPERIILAGFSQGACLTLEFVARRPRRYGAVAGLTGGLIGPPGSLGGYTGSLEATPILLASGDPDPHVPWERVEESAAILESLGGVIDLHRYPGRAHTVSQDELSRLAELVSGVLQEGR
jgi:predicted esterase